MSAHMTAMTANPEEKPRPDAQQRYSFPASIFVAVHPVTPPRRLDGARAMLRHPGFWAIMLGLTLIMIVGAVMLADHLHSAGEHFVPSTGRAYSALSG